MECRLLEDMRQYLAYDPSTGVFMWLQDIGRAKAGSVAGCIRKNGYRSINFRKNRYLCQRLAWLFSYGKFPEFVMDHIDGDRTNNAISNLRDVPERINFHNRSSLNANNTTGLAGVSIGGRGYVSQIMINRKRIHLGVFDTKEQAHEAYIKAKADLCESW